MQEYGWIVLIVGIVGIVVIVRYFDRGKVNSPAKAKELGEFRAPTPKPTEVKIMADKQEVIVKDIQMSFGSMVSFMVKWALASKPAFIILFVIGMLTWAFLLGAIK